MKTLVLLSLSLSVALGIPVLPPGVAQSPVLTDEKQSPLLGDWVPLQGHVEVEDPAPQLRLDSKEKQEKVAPMDMKQSQSTEGLEVKAEQELKEESEVKPEPEVKVDPEVEMESELEAEPDFKVESEVKVDPEVEMESELEAEPDFKVESEVKVDPDVQMEPELAEVQVQKNPEKETDLAIEEMHMEREFKMVEEPVEDYEPLDDDHMFGEEANNIELSEVETYLGATFQSEDDDVQLLPEEEMSGNQDALFKEGPMLDIMGQQMSLKENYLPLEDAGMRMRPEEPENSLTMDLSNYPHYMKEEGSEEDPPVEYSEVSAVEGDPELDGVAQIGVVSETGKQAVMDEGAENPREKRDVKQGRQYCPGVVLQEKCYQFFKEPKRAEEAEFFCQEHFIGGHLASITNIHIHREVMDLILRSNGAYTRTWVGGLRYLKTDRFIWLDGSRWGYDDWLNGEPNNTSDLEECLEVLPAGNGKFNDFTCWEPQAFICSYQ